ncbi:MAG: hypothetical protein P8P17_08600, partial [Pseudomonadales bacterium]|nr:hypothetical protein [Pseudomonadales bacterium]
SPPTKRAQGNNDVKHSLKSLSPGEWGDKLALACSCIRCIVILFAFNFLHGGFVRLWHNEFSNLLIRREYPGDKAKNHIF